MTKMYLNVETVSNAQKHMATHQKEIAETITTLTAAVHRLQEGAWVGNSASQFFLEYESLDAGWKRQMENMRIFTERMKQEIDEWIDVASKMS